MILRFIYLISNNSKINYKISPVDVKYSSISLGRFKELFDKKIEQQFIVQPKNFNIEGDIIKIPSYMMFAAFNH